MKYICDQDWETLRHTFRSATPFPNVCIDGFLKEDFVKELAASYPEYSEICSEGVEFKTVNERGKIQVTDSSLFPEPVSKLHHELKSHEFLQAMELMSGYDKLHFDDAFSGGGMHITNSSGILDVHVDFNRLEGTKLFRKLNLLIYLNEEWNEDWGGEIEFWDKDVKNCKQRLSPIINRCVIFETSDHSFHGVTAVNSPPNVSRKSFAIYLYSNESSTDVFGDTHSTIFKARPDEHIKKYLLMPISAGISSARSHYANLKSGIKSLIGKK